MTHSSEDDTDPACAAAPPFAPFPPYPPFAPFPPYPAYPSAPCPAPAQPIGPEQPAAAATPAEEVAPEAPPPSGGDNGGNGGGTRPPPGGGGGEGGVALPASIPVRRPDDLLVATLRFSGFILHTDPPRLERAATDAHISVELPPQSFGEEAFPLVAGQNFNAAGEDLEVSKDPAYPHRNIPGADGSRPASLPLSRIRMAAPSRVVVAMPASLDGIAFDLASVLTALRDWPMRLALGAAPDPVVNINWLDAVVGQPAWRGLQAELSGFLESLGGTTVTSAITEAAQHLASAAEDTVAGQDSLVLRHQLLGATATLAQQFPALATSAGRTASLAALSLASGAALTASPRAMQAATAKLQGLPFVSLLLGPQEPADSVTALEMPYRLVTSPLAPARWHHSLAPVVRSGRTELWHSRLANPGVSTGAEAAGRLRAIWSPDYRPQPQLPELYKLISAPGQPGQPNPDLLRMSLDPVDRAMLVTLMAGYDATMHDGSAYQPLSAEAKRLHLSALGGLLDAEGNWSRLPDGIDLQQWRHQASLGRDAYVRVMYAGWLCPFGHAASLIKVTERRFEALGPKAPQRVAVLRQRFFLAVREPVQHYAGANHAAAGRTFPFTQVEILTRITPDLSEPGMGASHLAPAPGGGDPYANLAPRMLFWPMVPAATIAGTADVAFEIAATDLAGNRVTFAMPLLFVGKPANDLPANTKALKAAYNAAPARAKRRAGLAGATVAYAPGEAADKGDPKLPTADITFRAGDVLSLAEPNFYPEVELATVGVKAVQKLLAQPGFVAEVSYPAFYAQHGFGAAGNAGQVFLQFTDAVPLAFGAGPGAPKSDALGALASPQMSLLGLSRIMGPVAGKDAKGAPAVLAALDKVSKAQFDPTEFFGDATLLGGIKLGDIVSASLSLAGVEVPKLVARDFPDRVEASFDWDSPVTSSDGRKLLVPQADLGKPETHLVMHAVIRTPLDPSQPGSFEATAKLNNFKINLFGFIILWFEELTFTARSGQKPDVSVELRAGDDAVTFGGPLEFVNALRSLIPGNGFSDPPGLVVTPSGISASYSLTLPAAEVGIFALANAALSASFSLPFDGTPAVVKFYFSSREHPFSLTVSLLGGGGFFGIGISSHGVNEIEAALEFGAVVALNLGVASGSVEVKAGIYFHWLEPAPDKGSVDLAGYVRIHGELCMLALISVSLTFNLQLGFHKEGGKASVYGEAELTVEIDILMFNTSVSVRCRREFSGGKADPKFIAQVPTQAIWAEYCGAFAPEPA